MKTVYSKYKIFGGFGIVMAMTGLAGCLTWLVFYKMEANPFKIESWQITGSRIGMLFALGLQVITLLLLMTQCKFIIANRDGLTFINPLLPFIRKTRKWTYYDKINTLQETTQYGSYEAIWLIKNNRLKDRISSFYYVNYSNIKNEIGINISESLDINPFRLLVAFLGVKIKSGK
jgi:hypothetical protein